MAQLEFEYSQRIVMIQANFDDLFKTVFDRYYQKANIKPNSVVFIANGIKLSENKRIIDSMNQMQIMSRKIRIFVASLNNSQNYNYIIESKEIICPKCFEECRIKIIDYIINLFDCRNNHLTALKLDNFKEYQKIDLSKIKCDICKIKNKGNTYNNEFYTCLNCRINLCVLCKTSHNKSHIIINYDQKDFICPIHYNPYFKYCYNCKINICPLCHNEHINHKLQSFENFISNIDGKRIDLNKLKNEINIFNIHVKKIITGLNQLIENMETYYKIFDNIFNNYNINNNNYQVLKNLSQINLNENIYKEIYEINRNKNYLDKVNKIFNIYYKMKGKNDNDPFNFYRNIIEKKNLYESSRLFLFSEIPSYIKKENRVSNDSIYRCNYCPYTPLMKILYKGYTVYMEYRCQNGHYSYEKIYDFYQRNKKIQLILLCALLDMK